MARRVDREPAVVDAEQEAAYLRCRARALSMRLVGMGGGRGRALLERAHREGGGDRRKLAAAMDRAAVEFFGADRTESIVRSTVEARSGWAPLGDFAVSGPYAPPPEIVAERRALHRGPRR